MGFLVCTMLKISTFQEFRPNDPPSWFFLAMAADTTEQSVKLSNWAGFPAHAKRFYLIKNHVFTNKNRDSNNNHGGCYVIKNTLCLFWTASHKRNSATSSFDTITVVKSHRGKSWELSEQTFVLHARWKNKSTNIHKNHVFLFFFSCNSDLVFGCFWNVHSRGTLTLGRDYCVL